MASRPAFVVKFRGGTAHGEFRIALERVPENIECLCEGGRREVYAYAGEEPQTRETVNKHGQRESTTDIVYHIFRPAPVAA